MQFFCIATVAWCIFANIVAHFNNNILLLISLDGFRWDYLKMVKDKGKTTPNFDSLVTNGVTITDGGVNNAFVTVTLPNHYSIVTGLYEESHGMVANSYYDPVYNSTFNVSHITEDKWWNNGTDSDTGPEPIWVTNEKGPQTIFKRRSGVYFWSGGEAKIKGRRPYHYEKYNLEVPFNERAETVINWFRAEDDPINLGLLYFHEPDATGHVYGPDSEEMVDKIIELDGNIGSLIDKLKQHKLFEKINIILTSDHGMQQIPDNHLVSLTPHISESDVDHYIDEITFTFLYARPDKVDSVYEALKGLEHVTVYKKEDIPAEFHYRYNRRIPSIFVTADACWLVSMKPFNYTAMVLALGFTATVAGIITVAACRAQTTLRGHSRIPVNLDIVETQTLQGNTQLLGDYDEEDEIH